MTDEKKRVLVIDDNEETLEIISTKLAHLGYLVESAPDGETGLDLARRLSPRLILLDIMLPRMDGWEVLEELRSTEETKNIPVILITAYTTIQFSGERQRAELWGSGVIISPCPFDGNAPTNRGWPFSSFYFIPDDHPVFEREEPVRAVDYLFVVG